MTTTPPTMTNAEAAQHITRTLGPVLPLCHPKDGRCACSGRYDRDLARLVPHEGHDIAKAPISKLARNGVDDATPSSPKVDLWWRTEGDAGVGLALNPARVLFIDPDSPEALAEAERQGLAGGVRRESRNVGFLFRRPDDCPIINISKSADGTDLEIRTDGYAVVWNTHQDGSPVRVDLSTHLVDAPAWAVDRLKRKAAEKAAQDATRAARRAERGEHGTGDEPPVRGLSERSLRRWRGELVVEKNGKTNRSDSLYFIALDLAEHGASEAAIEAAIRERDVALGWEKFTHRPDADERYREAAERAVAWVVEQEKAPKLRITSKAAPAGDPAADELTRARAEIAELQETVKDLTRWVDRLADVGETQKTIINAQRAELEDKTAYITLVTDVLAKPNEEMSSTQKVVFLAMTWETHYRADRGRTKLPLIALEERTGLSTNTVSTASRSICEREGSPFERTKTREWRTFEDGSGQWVTTVYVRPRAERVAETIRAGIAMPKAPEKPKHGGSEAAVARRQEVRAWGRCSTHDNPEVTLRGLCPDCGECVGERRMTRAEFAALNHQVGDSENGGPSDVSSVPKGHNPCDSDGRPSLDHQDGGSARPTTSGANGHGEYLLGRDPSLPPVDVDVTGGCPACGTTRVLRGWSGIWSCASCSTVVHVEARGSEQPPLILEAPPAATNGHHPTVPGAFR